MGGSREHGNESLDSIKGREFLTSFFSITTAPQSLLSWGSTFSTLVN